MIDRRPVPGNFTEYLEEYAMRSDVVPNGAMLHDTPPVRVSSVLGPDGNPLWVDLPRRKVGFDLSRQTLRSE